MLNNSDIVIRDFINYPHMLVVSKHYYNNYTTRLKNSIRLLDRALAVIEEYKLIKFYPTLIFKFGSLYDGKYFKETGSYIDNIHLLCLDINHIRGRTEFLQSLCHELVHSEQENIGKSYWKYGKPYWKGKKYKWTKDVDTLEKCEFYEEYPWEKEAYRRQGELACEVMGLIKEKEYK